MDAISCPRCALDDEARRRDHKTRHAADCPARGRGRSKRLVVTDDAHAPTAAAEALTSRIREIAARTKVVPSERPRAALTNRVRDSFLATFEALGSDEFLLEWAASNPSRFVEILTRMLPKEDEGAARTANVKIVIASASDMRPVIDVSPDA
jgi:hypothetical protein